MLIAISPATEENDAASSLFLAGLMLDAAKKISRYPHVIPSLGCYQPHNRPPTSPLSEP
jgi:hypothetical protein